MCRYRYICFRLMQWYSSVAVNKKTPTIASSDNSSNQRQPGKITTAMNYCKRHVTYFRVVTIQVRRHFVGFFSIWQIIRTCKTACRPNWIPWLDSTAYLHCPTKPTCRTLRHSFSRQCDGVRWRHCLCFAGHCAIRKLEIVSYQLEQR